jgi:hypothetical protein
LILLDTLPGLSLHGRHEIGKTTGYRISQRELHRAGWMQWQNERGKGAEGWEVHHPG